MFRLQMKRLADAGWTTVLPDQISPDGQLSIIDGQLSIIDGQLSIIDGQLSNIDGRWSMVDGRWFEKGFAKPSDSLSPRSAGDEKQQILPPRSTGDEKQQTLPPRSAGDEIQQTLPPRSAGGELKGGAPVNNKHFHLIFDDGYENIYRYAFPVLNELGFRASIFIPSDYIGRTNDWDHQLLGRRFQHLSGSKLKELSSAGWMIGSHGVSHKDLTRVSEKQLEGELINSRTELQDIIGTDVGWISFPFGRYGAREIGAAVKAGYSGCVVPYRRSSVRKPIDFHILEADAVYLWDTVSMVTRRLRRCNGYPLGRRFRILTNSFSLGTVIWKRLFSKIDRRESLATFD